MKEENMLINNNIFVRSNLSFILNSSFNNSFYQTINKLLIFHENNKKLKNLYIS
jgi:hypothetical protein